MERVAHRREAGAEFVADRGRFERSAGRARALAQLALQYLARRRHRHSRADREGQSEDRRFRHERPQRPWPEPNERSTGLGSREGDR